MCRERSSDDRNDPEFAEQGFALLVVIWTTGLLAMLVAGFSLAVRTEVRSASIAVENAEAEAMADAGVHLAVASLISARVNPPADRRIPADGSPSFCALGDRGILRISIEDEAGKIDLNVANDRLLRALFLGLGLSDAEAAARADAIIDFRDLDSQRRPSGAELMDYEAAGRLGPKNAPFARAEELVQVAGMDPDSVLRLLPYVSVHSGQPGVGATVASKALIALVARGHAKLTAPVGQQPISQPLAEMPAEFAVASPQRAYSIRAEARTVRGSIFVREAVVELSRTRAGISYGIKRWQRGQGISTDFNNARAANALLSPC